MPPCRGAFLAALLLLFSSEVRGDCPPPNPILYAELRQEPKPSYPVGTVLRYSCISGYEYIPGKQPTIQCRENSQWSPVDVFCQGRRCPLPILENGNIVEQDSDLRLGAQITFYCYEGYRVIGRNGARCILRSGNVVWNNAPPHCERIPCYPPPEIPNGRHDGSGRDHVYGSAVTYRCDDTYSLIGNKTIVCVADKDQNGKWSGAAPQCKVVKCGRPPEVPNGVMLTSYQPSYTYLDRVVFRCLDNYRLKNNKGDITCGANSTWGPHLPECIEGTTTGSPVGPTTWTPVGSTVKLTEETTEIGFAEPTEPPKDDTGFAEPTEPPKDDTGSAEPTEPPKDDTGSSVAVIVGAVVAVIAVAVIAVAITVAALKNRAHLKRQGKSLTPPTPSESYTPVPHNADISLEEKKKPIEV